jgi:lipopolysaccharide/colanic/teichoic acid biosynthesis glycosyltransferase
VIDVVAWPGRQQAGASPQGSNGAGTLAAGSRRPQSTFREEIRNLVGAGWVEELVVRGEGNPETVAAAVEAGRSTGRRVRVASATPLALLPPALDRERWRKTEDATGQSWVLVPPQRARLMLAIKRLIDVAVGATLLILLLPVLVAAGLAVKLTSEGPVLYRWRVLGENGRPFVGFKFRTMVPDADALKPQLLHLNERRGPAFKITQDPRITPLGHWLRKYSLDELPQLWSVLAGDMSLVGPRPVFQSDYKEFELWQMRKLSVKPGLTCLWQVDGRQTVTDFSDWARLDLKYIDTWSLWHDAAILLRTPMAIIKGTGH